MAEVEQILTKTVIGKHKTEREAAIALDTYLLNKGLQPINILKPKP